MSLIAGCGNNRIILTGSLGIPDSEFLGIEPDFAEEGNLGDLTESYMTNTESLIIVNGRLHTLCVTHLVEDCTAETRH